MKSFPGTLLIAVIPAFIASLAVSCNKDDNDNETPACTIKSPASGSTYQLGETVIISVDASDRDGVISKVDFFIDGVIVISLQNPPYDYSWVTASAAEGTHTVRAVATDNRGLQGFDSIGIELIEGTGELTITDSRDGKVYEIIRIGIQWWMAENLNFDSGSGCWIYEDDPGHADLFGRLYDWQTASEACPEGWHLPDDGEWAALIDFLGGENVAGGKLKSTGTVLWSGPNAGATNESRFNALPGGDRDAFGNYYAPGQSANFWTSTAYGGDAVFRQLLYDSPGVTRGVSQKESGLSVRCIKD